MSWGSFTLPSYEHIGDSDLYVEFCSQFMIGH
jgi:hypothetical protein